MNIFPMSLRKAVLLGSLLGSALLSSFASATDFSTAIAGRIFCDANCNDQIDEGIDIQLMKVKVQLFDENGNLLQTTTPEAFGGVYIFPDLVPGKKYYVRVVPALGQDVINAFPSQNAIKVTKSVISVVVVSQGETYYPNDFLLSCATKSWNQCEWGNNSCGFNPIDLIGCRFNELFPNGVVIGGIKTLTFTSKSAILRFLPATGNPRKLIMSRVDPLSNAESKFAGNVLALTLNIKMSDEGITGEGLGDRTLKSGPLEDMSLYDLLDLANRVLGGETGLLPAGMDICDLNWYIEWANNRNWEDDCCGCNTGCGSHDHNGGGGGHHGGGHGSGCGHHSGGNGGGGHHGGC